MSETTKVWTSEAWFGTRYMKWISFDKAPHNAEVAEKFVRGEYIDPSWFPNKIYQDHKAAKLADISLVQNGLILISERLADVLRSFELGKNQLVETELYDHTRQARLSDQYFFLNVTEKKPGSFVYEESKGPFMGDAAHGFLTSTIGYGGIAVRESAVLGGVDLWMDPILKRTPFFSGPLGDAIKKGKFGRTGLKPCVVLS